MFASVIVPTYNGAQYISLTLESIISQTISDWELLVVDDGSRDGTLEIVQRYVDNDRRIRLLKQSVGNVASSRNLGLSNIASMSQYVIFLDHDDVLESDALLNLISELDANSEAVAAHGLARYIDGEGERIREGEAEEWTRNRQCATDDGLIAWPVSRPTIFAVEAVANYIFTPGQVAIRRSALDAIGPLDPATAPADDYDLWLRLCAMGDMAFMDRIVLNFRQHSSNQSRRARMMTRKERMVRRKMFNLLSILPEQRRIARLGWRLWYRQLAANRTAWAREALAHRDLIPAARHMFHAIDSFVVGTLLAR
jgi:glycosyltransferase involved in cell wall biosynthesis